MIIIPGPASQRLGHLIARELNTKTVSPVFKKFPDGELYLRVPEKIKDDMVIIVQSTYYPQLEHLFQLIQLAEAIGENKRIIGVIPYLCYARQDKQFLEGEAVSSKIVAKILEEYFHKIITVDIHSSFSLPKNGISISAFNILFEEAQKRLDNPVVILPDRGARERFKADMECVYFSKKRDRYTGEIEMEGDITLTGRDFVIIDDIISTGGTMAMAVNIASRHGRKVIAAATHGLMIGNSADRILSAGATEIITTDTVPSIYSKVSVAKILAKEIKKELI